MTDREKTIPQAPEGQLAEIRALLERLTRAVIGDPLDRTAPLGLVQRQDAQESQLADHEERLTIQEERANKSDDWFRTALWDLAKMAGAAGLGAWIGKGGH